MTTTTRPRITAKQQTVLRHMSRGKDTVQIAKAMQISPAGVRNHVRQMRKAGIELPEPNGNGRQPRATQRRSTRNDNGAVATNDPVLAAIEENLVVQHEQRTLIDRERQNAENQLKELAAKRDQVEGLIKRYSAARKDLLGK